MDKYIRLESIVRILNNRKSETLENLALDLGVSKRTIQRDVNFLARYKPIYTQSGRHGGIFILDGGSNSKPYINPAEHSIMIRVLEYIKIWGKDDFQTYEIELVESLITSLTQKTVKLI